MFLFVTYVFNHSNRKMFLEEGRSFKVNKVRKFGFIYIVYDLLRNELDKGVKIKQLMTLFDNKIEVNIINDSFQFTEKPNS